MLATSRQATRSNEAREPNRGWPDMTLRVLVCGGRDYKNRSRVFEALDRLTAEHGALTIIEGGAVGADTFAGEWTCMQRSCQLVTEHAKSEVDR